VGLVAKFSSKPNRFPWEAVKRIIAYLKETENDLEEKKTTCFVLFPTLILLEMETIGDRPLETSLSSMEFPYRGAAKSRNVWHCQLKSLIIFQLTWLQKRLSGKDSFVWNRKRTERSNPSLLW
jgi:hypothetical protein